jgi:hypothetical protein
VVPLQPLLGEAGPVAGLGQIGLPAEPQGDLTAGQQGVRLVQPLDLEAEDARVEIDRPVPVADEQLEADRHLAGHGFLPRSGYRAAV